MPIKSSKSNPCINCPYSAYCNNNYGKPFINNECSEQNDWLKDEIDFYNGQKKELESGHLELPPIDALTEIDYPF